MAELSVNPRYQPGKPPGRDFDNIDAPYGIKLGIITRVDEVNMKADVKVLTAGNYRPEIDLTQGMYGPRSFWGGVPEVNSMVVIGYRRLTKQLHDAVILAYFPSGTRSGLRFDPWSATDPANIDPDEAQEFKDLFGDNVRRYKRLLMRPGDVGGMSAAGSEMVLSRSFRAVNRAGDAFELRDVDRTLTMESIHKVEVQSGVRRFAGPVRRSAFYLPDDILQDPLAETKTLKTQDQGYYGRDELNAAGPGRTPEAEGRFASPEGVVNETFYDELEFPPTVYSNGRKAFYTATRAGQNFDAEDAAALAFVEDRLEMSHTSDLTQEVLEEIDGFNVDRRTPYIERVLGTTVGNTMLSTGGQRNYAEVLRPVMFQDLKQGTRGRFAMEAIDRNPATGPDTEVWATAGAFLFKIREPRSTTENDFACAITKQGKLFLNIPKATTDVYAASGASGVSAEMNLDGALKAYIGQSSPDRISAHISLEGGLHIDVGPDEQGNALTITRRGGVKTIVAGTPNQNSVASEEEVTGTKATSISGAENKSIQGTKQTNVSGGYQIRCDHRTMNATSGYSMNAGELNSLVSGKSQYQYALAVLETIAAGGKVSTILAGGKVDTIAAGAYAVSVGAGAMSTALAGGAYSVAVATGAISVTTGAGAVTMTTGGGAITITAGGGAVALTAGGAMALTAAGAIALIAPVISLGGPSAVLGNLRGIPALPPGVPTLCYITGIPHLGAATVLSN
jgi:hypothetical protein